MNTFTISKGYLIFDLAGYICLFVATVLGLWFLHADMSAVKFPHTVSTIVMLPAAPQQAGIHI